MSEGTEKDSLFEAPPLAEQERMVEAILFAWLARERLAGRLLDTGSITGAREPVLLGKISQPG